jgi:hypothetical protein
MSSAAKRQIIEALDDLPEQSLATLADLVAILRAKAVAGPLVREPESPESAQKARTAAARRAAVGMDAGKVWIADDFDAPLPDDIQRAFEGEDDTP